MKASALTRTVAEIGVMTALICILAPISIPVGPVPVSLGTLIMFLTVYVIGWKKGSLAVLFYLLLGMAGLPVLAGFAGGFDRFVGPTGGYLMSFLPMSAIAGFLVEKVRNTKLRPVWEFFSFLLAMAVNYAVGTAWLSYTSGTTFVAALGVGVLPFVAFDVIKVLIVLSVGPVVRRRLSR